MRRAAASIIAGLIAFCEGRGAITGGDQGAAVPGRAELAVEAAAGPRLALIRTRQEPPAFPARESRLLAQLSPA